MQPTPDQRQRFRWGIILAWIPLLIIGYFGFRHLFRDYIGGNRATGLGAVAGGLAGVFAEGLLILGVVSLFVTQIGSVVLLSRSKVSGLRGAIAVVTTGLSLITLALAGILVWFWVYIRFH